MPAAAESMSSGEFGEYNDDNDYHCHYTKLCH